MVNDHHRSLVKPKLDHTIALANRYHPIGEAELEDLHCVRYALVAFVRIFRWLAECY